MLLIDIFRLYKLNKIERKITKAKIKKRKLIAKLQRSNMLPEFYKDVYVKANFSASFNYEQKTANNNYNDVITAIDDSFESPKDESLNIETEVKIDVHLPANIEEKGTKRDAEAEIVNKCQKPESLPIKQESNSKAIDIKIVKTPTATINEVETQEVEIKNVDSDDDILSKEDIRFVSIDFEREEAFIQFTNEEILKKGSSNVIPIGMDQQDLSRFTVGNNYQMIVFKNGNVEFILESGEKIAC